MHEYLFYILNLVAIYAIAAMTLNLIIGFAGVFSVAHAAFMAVGAYVSTLLLVHKGLNFFLTLPIGIAAATIISIPVAYMSLRVKGELYIIGSMAFQFLFYNVLLNWVDVTRGPYGISGIPKPTLLGITFHNYPLMFVLSTALMLIVFALCWLLANSPYGLTLKAIREDETAVAASGKSVEYYKVSAFAISSGLVAVAGSLYAVLISFIDPYVFTIHDSIFLIILVIIGGSGNIVGSLLGAALLISLPEALKFILPMSPGSAGPIRLMIYGILLIVFMFLRPDGLLPEVKKG